MKLLKHNLTPLVLVSVLVISIFTLFFAASISYKQIRNRTESEKQVVNSYRIYVELEQLNSYAKDAELNQRGFLLTRDSSFIGSYYDAIEKINKSYTSLKTLTESDTNQSMNLDTLVFLINKSLSFLNDLLSRGDNNKSNQDTLTGVLRSELNIYNPGRDSLVFEDAINRYRTDTFTGVIQNNINIYSTDTLTGALGNDPSIFKSDTLTGVLAKSNVLYIYSPDTIIGILSKGRDIMTLTQIYIDKMVNNELRLLEKREMEHVNDIKFPPFSILFIVIFSLLVFSISFLKINKDLKGLGKINNQLLINNEIFKHSEQIAEISYWYWDINDNKISFSNNLYRLLGCNIHEFEPTFENFIKFIHPDDRKLVVEEHRKATAELSPTMTYFRIMRKDGIERRFKSIGKVITDNYGTRFSIGINADITEQYDKDKLLEEKLADLERSNKQLSAFNHIASHDLQEPLRKVQTFLSRIREADSDTLPEKVKEYLTGIEKAAGRMQKFILDLLLYSRASKADKRFEPADLNEILENTKRDLSQRIEEKNVIINSTPLPKLNVIPFQIQQLFTNLISNSIKYSKAGVDPVINIKTKFVKSYEIPGLKTDIEKKYYKISFSDNGIGFDPLYSDQIFTLFFRLHSNKEYSGTGIGLAICKIIVENHKGYIMAESLPEIGSTFSVFLPA